MPTLLETPLGHVTAIWGSALIRGEDGRMHALKVGDPVHAGDVILTSQNGIVEMTDERGGSRLASLLPPAEANQVIAALDKGEPDAAPSAGLAGGDGSLQPGLRVDRIAESITASSFHSQGALEARPFSFIGAPSGTSVPAAPNAPPQATPGSFSGHENTTIPVHLAGTDSDGTVIGITVTSIPAGSMLLLGDGHTTVAVGQTLSPAQAANLLFSPAHDFAGHLDVEFTVTDNRGATSAPALAQIGVIEVGVAPPPPANDAPFAQADAASTPRGTPVTIDVLANDRDPNGDALHVQDATVDPVLGSVVVDPDGTITFTPAPGATGTAQIGYSVADPSGATSTSSATVTLVNHVPLASSSAIEATEQGPAVSLGLAAPSDADGDALAIVVTSLPSIGQVQLADGTPLAVGDALDSTQLTGLKYLPPADYTADDAVGSFGYSVADGHGGSANATTAIAVAPVNDVPAVSGEQGGSVTEDATLVASGRIVVADADAGQSGTQAATLPGT
jgi:hypothetical protein